MQKMPLVRARVGTLYRAGYLTPYLIETIASDVRRAAEGTRVEVEVAGDADLDWLRKRLAPISTARIHIIRRPGSASTAA